MPNYLPAQRTPLLDESGILMSREWYRFFFDLLSSTSGGGDGGAITPVAVGPSPFTFTNGTNVPVGIVVSGGGVSGMKLKRGAVEIDTGSFYGMFELAPSDKLVIDYSSAPNVSVVPL